MVETAALAAHFCRSKPLEGADIFLLRTMSFLFALVAGGLASQMPEFVQQYRQRLGGAIDELQRFMSDFDRDARTTGLTRAQGIETLRKNDDKLASQRGRRIRETEARLARLKRQQSDFRDAGSFRRIAVMTRQFDTQIAKSAYAEFEPAIPITGEGLVTALAGFLAGLGIWKFFAWPVNAVHKRRRNRMSMST